tara:strand:- start:14 stop:199 length:186 start_codon:yes stop_codon:yes gene_type:complete
MAGSRMASKNRVKQEKKTHMDREIVPVKLMPGGMMAARYKDDEFSVIRDQFDRPIPFKNLP